MTQRFGFELAEAGKYMTLIFVVATASLIPISYYIDKIGKRINVIMFSSVFLAILHLFTAHLSNSYDNPNKLVIITLIGAGIGYGVYASVSWPTLALTAEPKVRGTAFGLCGSLQNFALAIGAHIIGWVHDVTIETDHGYYWTEIYLVLLSVLGYAAGYQILKEDEKNGTVLNASASEEQQERFHQMNEETSKEIEMSKV